ncbi:unnamed protein product [Pleuronectes platessa]|uniref:MADF domain-containing protein n=1 Tax=Pleuronectes platessa TaxID=8262 RepID=A0A9N7V2K1_PLEPL|nr:unnamed protein product [Pleuronectes platessa]
MDSREELLSEEVRKYEHLYNPSMSEYKDTEMASNSWKEISANVGLPVEECTKPWRRIRDKYVRQRKMMSPRAIHLFITSGSPRAIPLFITSGSPRAIHLFITSGSPRAIHLFITSGSPRAIHLFITSGSPRAIHLFITSGSPRAIHLPTEGLHPGNKSSGAMSSVHVSKKKEKRDGAD